MTRTGSFEGILYVREKINGFLLWVKAIPWLRCPSIENQTIHHMSPIVKEIRDKIYNDLGWPTNIAKIQKYSYGTVYIKPHADKILDLSPDTPIFLIRFGATRTAVLEHKVTKEIRKIEMPHDTLLVLDYKDNLEWIHSIAQEPNITEPGYSIVFRQSVTFLDLELGVVYGEHTPFKTKKDINLDNVNNFFSKEKQTEELVKMYNNENNSVLSLDDYGEIMVKAIFP